MAWGRLALLQAADDQHALSKLAQVFAYAKIPEKSLEADPTDSDASDPGLKPEPVKKDESEEIEPQRKPALFLRVNQLIETSNTAQKPDHLFDPSMQLRAEDAPQGTYSFAAPEPLVSMAHVLPLLFNSLGQAKSSHHLDHRLLLRQIAQGKALQRLPKRTRTRWPQRLQIIIDASQRLEPYWADFEFIVRQLQALLGKDAVQALRFEEASMGHVASYCLPWPTQDHHQWQLWQVPPPDVAILILSDLGVDDIRAAVVWQRQLASLQNHPGTILTLSPAYRSLDDVTFCRQFKPTPYNDYSHLPRHPDRTGFRLDEPSTEVIDTVLSWLAPLPLIDTGLLRRLRIALQWGDSTLERVIWNHPNVHDLGLGIRLQSSVAERYYQRFQTDYARTDAAALFWDIVNQHHQHAYQGLRQLEKCNLSLLEKQDDPEMREYYLRVCASGLQSSQNSGKQVALRLQCRTILASLPEAIWSSDLQELAYQVYAVAYQEDILAGKWPDKLPPDFNPDRLQWVKPDATKARQEWQIVQLDDQGQVQCAPCNENINIASPVLNIKVKQGFPPRLTISKSNKVSTQIVQKALNITLAERERVLIEANGLSAEIETISRPSWASQIWRDAEGLWASIHWLNQDYDIFWQVSKTDANGAWQWPEPFGEDHLGVYLDLTVNKVIQRFRWLEPGTFMMGSPRDEPEREWKGIEEGKGTEAQHQVTLSQGFWMADTAVTQAFWLAIMGDNPSKFKESLENPVEQVSWQDSQTFITKLNQLFPDLNAQLPSEAQWEYACRAGTSTTFSFGDNISSEQVNYNANYPYAAGEKGVYREQTVPVKSLPANPWGLYEMHGNVWEWCADIWQQQVLAEPVSDPLMVDGDSDSFRVVLGGSWRGNGGGSRSAIRVWYTPVNRDFRLGFRLALGHAEKDKTRQVTTGKVADSRVAEQRQAVASPVEMGEPQQAGLIHRLTNWIQKDKKT